MGIASLKNAFTSEKSVHQDDSDVDHRGSLNEPAVGELRPGEAESGGLGRHLGLFSTTFLM